MIIYGSQICNWGNLSPKVTVMIKPSVVLMKAGVMLQTFQVFPCSGNSLQWLRVTLFPVCSLFYLLKDCSGCILYSFIAYFAGTFLFFRIFDVCSLVLFVIVISSIFYKNERCHVYRVLLSTSSKPCLSNKVIYIFGRT